MLSLDIWLERRSPAFVVCGKQNGESRRCKKHRAMCRPPIMLFVLCGTAHYLADVSLFVHWFSGADLDQRRPSSLIARLAGATTFEGKVAVTLGRYKGITIEGVPRPEVPDAAIDGAFAKKKAKKTKFERINFTGSGARLGHTVLIDMEGKYGEGHPQRGSPIPGTKLKGFELELKEGQPEPWRQFVTAITERGMGQMEEKTFAVHFPQDYKKEAFAGQTVDFKVLVREIGELRPIEPDLRPEAEQKTELAAELERVAVQKSNEFIDKHLREKLLQVCVVDTETKTKNVAWAKFGPESERAMKWNFILEEVARVEGIKFADVMPFLRKQSDIQYAAHA